MLLITTTKYIQRKTYLSYSLIRINKIRTLMTLYKGHSSISKGTHLTTPIKIFIPLRFVGEKPVAKMIGKAAEPLMVTTPNSSASTSTVTTSSYTAPSTETSNAAANLRDNPGLPDANLPSTNITQESPSTLSAVVQQQTTPSVPNTTVSDALSGLSPAIQTGKVEPLSLQANNNSSQEQFSMDNTFQDQPVEKEKPFTDLVNTTGHNAWTSQKGTGVDFTKPEFQKSKNIVIDFNNSEPITEGFALARKMGVSETVISSEEVQEAINLFKEMKPNDLKQALNVLKDMTPKKGSMILTQDSPSVVRAKLSVQHFVQGLKRYKNDEEFIRDWIKAMEEYSHSMTRAFQVAMEITFAKRNFSGEALTTVLENIALYKVGESGSNTIDSSTLYSALQTYYITKRHHVESVVVIAPAADTANVTKVLLSPKDQELLLKSIQATGNTICDIKFFDHYYDYKNNNFKFMKNHIFMLDFEEITNSRKAHRFLFQLLGDFAKIAGNTDLEREYLEKAISKLDYILKDSKSTSIQKLDEWNAYVFLTLERRPTTILFPLLIPASRDPVVKEMLDPAIAKMTFPLKKALETFDLKKILNEIYSRMTPDQLKDVTYITRGAYEENDLPVENN
jgi:hypothetical protein